MPERREEVWCKKCAALVTAFRFNEGQWRCTGGPHPIEVADSGESASSEPEGATASEVDEDE